MAPVLSPTAFRAKLFHILYEGGHDFDKSPLILRHQPTGKSVVIISEGDYALLKSVRGQHASG